MLKGHISLEILRLPLHLLQHNHLLLLLNTVLEQLRCKARSLLFLHSSGLCRSGIRRHIFFILSDLGIPLIALQYVECRVFWLLTFH